MLEPIVDLEPPLILWQSIPISVQLAKISVPKFKFLFLFFSRVITGVPFVQSYPILGAEFRLHPSPTQPKKRADGVLLTKAGRPAVQEIAVQREWVMVKPEADVT